MSEQLGTTLVRLRQHKGYTQLRVAEGLCRASGETTVTRHEVSRWERQERIPSALWLRWLAEVLEVPMTELEAAAAATRKATRVPSPPMPSTPTATAAPVGNGTRLPRPPRTMQQATSATRNGNKPLSTVTIEFEHQATSVRLSATYDDPRRAVLAIEAFPLIVEDDERVRAWPGQIRPAVRSARAETSGAEVRGGAAQQAGQPVPFVQQRPSASAALTANKPTEVPMGIRYTKGPGARERSA